MKLSIRKFLLFNLLLAITLTTSLTAIGSYYLNRHDIQLNFDRVLMEAALSLQVIAGDNISSDHLEAIQKKLNTIPAYSKKYFSNEIKVTDNQQFYEFQIVNNKNQVLLHSVGAPATSFADIKDGFSDKYINGRHWHVFTIHHPSNPIIFVVGEHQTVRTYLLNRMAKDDFYILLLTFPISGLLIWFIIGRGLQSVRNVEVEVARRAADHLEPVDLAAVPTEIKPLVDELNKLFLRLKQAFEREQRFAADAAHELRTPLAALRTQAQVALKTSDQQDRRTHLNNVIIGVDRCTHVIQQLLTLCRVSPESASLEDPALVDLAKLATDAMAQLVPSALDKQIDLELIVQPNTEYCLVGNATGLYALIRNLVDNAIRYTPTGGEIKVIIDSFANALVLRVIDNGPGIPVELRSRVFERFYRVLGTNTSGSGLGLAIVQQIVNLHHGKVTLGVPKDGVGLEVEVILPRNK